MPMTTAACSVVAAALTGGVFTPFDASHSYIGVGDSTTAFATSQTQLQASTNFLLKPVDSGFPTQTGASIVYQATFANADAVFSWQEIGIFNGATQGGATTMLNRFLSNLGSK